MTGALTAMNVQSHEHARRMQYPGYLQTLHTYLKIEILSKKSKGNPLTAKIAKIKELRPQRNQIKYRANIEECTKYPRISPPLAGMGGKQETIN
jgi:hypothetical protein